MFKNVEGNKKTILIASLFLFIASLISLIISLNSVSKDKMHTVDFLYIFVMSVTFIIIVLILIFSNLKTKK